MDVRHLVIEGCPHSGASAEALSNALVAEGLPAVFRTIVVGDREEAVRERFLGSPSVQIDGLDIEVQRRADPPAFGCRVYRSGDGTSGAPGERLIRSAIRRARGAKARVLFLCTGNSCRSQMAEGWARSLRGDTVDVASAGIETHGLNPNAVKVMAEAGIDISAHTSKMVRDLADRDFDFVVTVCGHAAETCPVMPGAKRIVHYGFDDPPRLARGAAREEEALSHYRRVRDEIRGFVEKMPGILEELAQSSVIVPKVE